MPGSPSLVLPSTGQSAQGPGGEEANKIPHFGSAEFVCGSGDFKSAELPMPAFFTLVSGNLSHRVLCSQPSHRDPLVLDPTR